MQSRVLRIFVLLLASVWFGAIVPGHTRGVVQMPGGARATSSTDAKPASSCCGGHETKGPQQDDAPAKGSCAVCHFAAALMAAPPVSFDLASLGLVGALAPPAVGRIVCPPVHQPYHGRAPPAGARP